MITTSFKEIGMGVVATPIQTGSHVIDVLLSEWFPFQSGEVTNSPELLDQTVQTPTGSRSATLAVGTTIKATWLKESNRLTPPSVARGERVVVYSAGDSGFYYWRSIDDSSKRKRETFVFAIAAKKDFDNTPLTTENSYFFEVSSENQSFTFSTNQAGGEVCKWVIHGSGKDGTLSVSDGDDLGIELNSPDDSVAMTNHAGSEISIKQGKLKMQAPEQVVIASGGTYWEFNPDGTIAKSKSFNGGS